MVVATRSKVQAKAKFMAIADKHECPSYLDFSRWSLYQLIFKIPSETWSSKDRSNFMPIVRTIWKNPKPWKNSESWWKLHHFEGLQVLGEGAHGTVFRALHKETGYIVALKKVSTSSRHWESELDIHKSLDHPGILSMFGHFFEKEKTKWDNTKDEHFVFLILEFCPGGTLADRLRKSRYSGLCESQVAQYYADIVDALQYLHSKYILHRDIKPMNILLTEDNRAVLADLGASVRDSSPRRQTFTGTLGFMAPEITQKLRSDGDFYNETVDVWSLGALLFTLLVGKEPYPREYFFRPSPSYDSVNWQRQQSEISDILSLPSNTGEYSVPGYGHLITNVVPSRGHEIVSHRRDRLPPVDIPHTLSDEVKDLLKRLLEEDPNERLSLIEAAQNPWVKLFT
jgi:serine/threonine protein kinase